VFFAHSSLTLKFLLKFRERKQLQILRQTEIKTIPYVKPFILNVFKGVCLTESRTDEQIDRKRKREKISPNLKNCLFAIKSTDRKTDRQKEKDNMSSMKNRLFDRNIDTK
jgi:hypothetical protein